MVAINSHSPGRTLPHSTEDEAALLSSALIDGPDVVAKAVMVGITPERMYDSKNATIWSAILHLYACQKPIESSTVAQHLKQSGLFDLAGGYSHLSYVSRLVGTSAAAGPAIEGVRRHALLRSLIRSRTSSVESAYSFVGPDIDDFVAEVTAKEGAATALESNLSEESVAGVCDTLIADLNRPKSQRNASRGLVSWGLPDIDRFCGLMAPGDLVILAGMPSSGKSALCDQAVWNCAASGRHAVQLSLEMSKAKKVIRLAQQISRVNLKQIDDVPADVRLRFIKAVEQVKGCSTLHLFEHDRTLVKFRARCLSIHRKTPLSLIAVDFLQYLARLEPSIGKEPMSEKIGRLTAGLKSLGAECGCPVLVLSSLNREGYRDGAQPTLASLKASGEIESDADVVAFLHWPPTNPKTGQRQDPLDTSQNVFYGDFLQEKGRDSGVAKVGLSFTRSATKWDCIAR